MTATMERTSTSDMPAAAPGWLAAAIAAPSVHNTQPWRFAVDGNRIRVLADHDRGLRVIDPAGRQLLMSVAAAAFNLRLAIRAHGRVPLHRVLPSPGVVLAVVPAANSRPRPSVLRLRAAVGARRTSRAPFVDAPPSRAALRELFAAAAIEGAELSVCPPLTRDWLLTVGRAASERLLTSAAYRDELAAWTGSCDRFDGVPESAFGAPDARRRIPGRWCGAGRPVPFEAAPTLAVLTTAYDGPRAWVDAGQALQRVLLTAAVYGLSAQPLQQALEVPELRARVNARFGGRRVQAVLRIGRATVAPAATPRRPVPDLLAPRRYGVVPE
ncbi:Acg family FMN-binding oxidoreductase [Catenuloplanes atrovinosus]|uniref:Nitroreductase n=1 Tax=Catenuloplanes atrovinosus TaxID=137266 RepID=A0AAE3YP82_9ACTN|nr:nitroreductase [Catenuloplanes atrovinosus]MDR7276122.1 nitroreductase [Catenuloplanes atrovinosus]